MKIDVTETGGLRLKEVFNTVLFESGAGEELLVCMRDSGFEIGIVRDSDKKGKKVEWFEIKRGKFRELSRDKVT